MAAGAIIGNGGRSCLLSKIVATGINDNRWLDRTKWLLVHRTNSDECCGQGCGAMVKALSSWDDVDVPRRRFLGSIIARALPFVWLVFTR